MRTRRSESKFKNEKIAGKRLWLALALVSFLWFPAHSSFGAETLDETCIATMANRSLPVNPDGTFAVSGPTPNGQFRVRMLCDRPDGLVQAQSGFLTGIPNGVTEATNIIFGDFGLIPSSLTLATTAATLTPAELTAQITTTGNLAGGITEDMTSFTTGTFYTSSNPAIAGVSPEGLVTAVASGTVFITARNEGVVATLPIQVILSDDTDGDGLPDDYEVANAINPGGANLALQAGTTALASSTLAGSSPAAVFDGNRATSWYANTGDAANLGGQPIIEVTLPADGQGYSHGRRSVRRLRCRVRFVDRWVARVHSAATANHLFAVLRRMQHAGGDGSPGLYLHLRTANRNRL